MCQLMWTLLLILESGADTRVGLDVPERVSVGRGADTSTGSALGSLLPLSHMKDWLGVPERPVTSTVEIT